MKRSPFDDTADLADALPHTPVKAKRTNYRCAANGCPNAGSIDDRGEDADKRGRCFWHWQAPHREWDQITTKILHTPSMRNHGKVPTEPSKVACDMHAKIRGDAPRGLLNATTGEAL
jgi:hypothetical protein